MYSPTPRDRREANRARRDERVPIHVVGDFHDLDAWADETPGTCADLDAQTVRHRGGEWQHPVGEVVSAVEAAGLRIEFLHEHDVSPFARFGSLVRHGDGFLRFPAGRPRVPLMYSLKATKPRQRTAV